MRKIRVLLLANVEDPTDRIVEVSADKNIDAMPVGQALGIILTYGQNDYQPQSLPSFSPGDVIFFKGTLYYGVGSGFIEITGEELSELKEMSRNKRAEAFNNYIQNSRKERGVPCENV